MYTQRVTVEKLTFNLIFHVPNLKTRKCITHLKDYKFMKKKNKNISVTLYRPFYFIFFGLYNRMIWLCNLCGNLIFTVIVSKISHVICELISSDFLSDLFNL